jgi:phosphonopyruvate decarboxylase
MAGADRPFTPFLPACTKDVDGGGMPRQDVVAKDFQAMMHTAELLKIFAGHRGDAIVVPGRGGRHWVQLSALEMLDAPLGDPAMGGHAGFALGLALAQPNRRVVLFDSEGDILMSLGMLATIAEQAPPNFYHFLLDNECYATTGGQPVPNARIVAYDALARGAGYPSALAFTELPEFAQALPGILANPGPVFVALKVLPEVENTPIGRRSRWNTRSREKVVQDLRTELGAGRAS